jgi:hypothetical protein
MHEQQLVVVRHTRAAGRPTPEGVWLHSRVSNRHRVARRLSCCNAALINETAPVMRHCTREHRVLQRVTAYLDRRQCHASARDPYLGRPVELGHGNVQEVVAA